MPDTLNEDYEVPDSGFDVLDRAGAVLCQKNTADLSTIELSNIDLMLANLFFALHNRAEEMAETSPIPGKIRDSVLRENIAGYQQACELATYLEGVLR